jgi:hypothetical protein
MADKFDIQANYLAKVSGLSKVEALAKATDKLEQRGMKAGAALKTISSATARVQAPMAKLGGHVDRVNTKFSNFAASARSSASMAASAWGQVGKAVTQAFGAVGAVALPAAGLGLGAGIAGGSILGAANFKEQTLVAFETMLATQKGVKDARLESAKLFLQANQFAAVTPFETGPVVDATKNLLAFGFNAKSELFPTLERAGNLAAGMNKPLGEVVDTIGRLKAGQFGEAFEGLRRLGITYEQLKGEGLKFDKNNTYQGSVDQALGAVEKIADKRFGKLMDKQSQTLGGLWSTLKSKPLELFQDLDTTGALKPVKGILVKAANLLDFNKGGVGKRVKQSVLAVTGTIFKTLAEPFEKLLTPVATPTSKTKWDRETKVRVTVYENMTPLELAVQRVQNRLNKFSKWWETNAPKLRAFADGVKDAIVGAFNTIAEKAKNLAPVLKLVGVKFETSPQAGATDSKTQIADAKQNGQIAGTVAAGAAGVAGLVLANKLTGGVVPKLLAATGKMVVAGGKGLIGGTTKLLGRGPTGSAAAGNAASAVGRVGMPVYVTNVSDFGGGPVGGLGSGPTPPTGPGPAGPRPPTPPGAPRAPWWRTPMNQVPRAFGDKLAGFGTAIKNAGGKVLDFGSKLIGPVAAAARGLPALAGAGGATLTGSVGAATVGTVGATGVAAGAVGYGVGTLIERSIPEKVKIPFQEWLADNLFGGNELKRQMLESDRRLQEVRAKKQREVTALKGIDPKGAADAAMFAALIKSLPGTSNPKGPAAPGKPLQVEIVGNKLPAPTLPKSPPVPLGPTAQIAVPQLAPLPVPAQQIIQLAVPLNIQGIDPATARAIHQAAAAAAEASLWRDMARLNAQAQAAMAGANQNLKQQTLAVTRVQK